MDDFDSDDERGQRVQNRPYDETLEVPDGEEVASTYTPTPRVGGGNSNNTPPMNDQTSDEDFEQDSRDTQMYNKRGERQFQPETGKDPGGREGGGPAKPQGDLYGQQEDEEDDDEDDDESDSDDSEDGDEVEGAYDPAEYENLPVSQDIKDLFQYIGRYTPQSIELEHKLKPFIPDFIPAVGDIDAFIKIPRPDNKPDELGLVVLDEPCAKQSDPTVLDLMLRTISKATNVKAMTVRSLDNAEKNTKAVDNWIQNIQELHRSKPPPTVHYTKNMPLIDDLMREWPPEFEELLKEVQLPTADLDCDLKTYVDLVCSILDIPVHKDRIQSLHVLFTLFSEFKNSQHFRSLADDNQLDNALKPDGATGDGADRLEL